MINIYLILPHLTIYHINIS